MSFEHYSGKLKHIFQVLHKDKDEQVSPWQQVEYLLKGIKTTDVELIGAKSIISSMYTYPWLWWSMCLLLLQSVLTSWCSWQDLHDGNKTCIQLSYWELVLENGQWLGCWITDGLCALTVTDWTGIHRFGYLFPLIWIAPFSAHKLIEQDTAVLH